jgi:hypothetical protein
MTSPAEAAGSMLVCYREDMHWCCRSSGNAAALCVYVQAVPIIRGRIQIFRTGRLERELQIVQLIATMCNFIAILWVSLVSFATITLCVASQRVFIVVVVLVLVIYLFINSVRKLLDTPSYSTRLSHLSCSRRSIHCNHNQPLVCITPS